MNEDNEIPIVAGIPAAVFKALDKEAEQTPVKTPLLPEIIEEAIVAEIPSSIFEALVEEDQAADSVADLSSDIASRSETAASVALAKELFENAQEAEKHEAPTISEAMAQEHGEPVEHALAEPKSLSSGTPGGAVGGIDILVQMAHKGEIDPKNIDIIDVTDRFLRAIAAAPKENLRQSGKILFHASVLLRMKAEALLAYQEVGDDYLDFDIDGSPIIYDSTRMPVARQITLQDLEKALVRRSHTHHIRQRKVTLDELIEALREAERIDEHKARRQIEPRVVLEGQHEVRDVEDILDLAHDEDIETVIVRVEQILVDYFNGEELMSLVKLIEILGGKGDWVDAFLAVLFLSNAGKLNLEQKEFWGPLYILRPDQGSPAPELLI